MSLRADTLRFSDVFLHSQAFSNWNQRYDQISPGSLRTCLRQVVGSRIHVFHELINQRVLEQGRAPRDSLCFAMPVVHTVAPIVQGRAVSCPSLLMLRGGDEFAVHLPCNTELMAFTIHTSALVEEESGAFANLPERMLKQPVMPLSPVRYQTAIDRLQKLLEQALDADSLTHRELFSEKLLVHSVIDVLFDLLKPDESGDRPALHMSTQSYVVRKSQEIAVESGEEILTVLDLCHRLKISRRMLQYSFQNVTGMTPTAYLRSIRLNAARRFLMTTPSTVRIGDAAALFGFCHFGRFSSYYQQQFSELPSQTPRA